MSASGWIDYVLNLGHSRKMKGIKFHPGAIEFIREQSPEVKRKIGEALRDLQKGMALGMPKSRPMPSIASGAAELRVKDAGSNVRVFYITKIADAIIVFHGFKKHGQKTPLHEIELGKKRLKEILNGEI